MTGGLFTDLAAPEPRISENHRRFLRHLRESEITRWLVAKYLSARGNVVTIPPVREAPSADCWENYADEGDLEIRQRVEVKRLSVDFTGPDDWPFRTNFIVCGKNAFDRAWPKPVAFFYVSSSGTHAAIVRASTAPAWRIERRSDRRYQGVTQEFYLAPLDCVEWIELETGAG